VHFGASADIRYIIYHRYVIGIQWCNVYVYKHVTVKHEFNEFSAFGTLKCKRLSCDNSAEDAENTASDVPVQQPKHEKQYENSAEGLQNLI